MDLTNASDADLTGSMGLFEAALAARAPVLADPPLRRVLLGLDGSNQDATAERLAVALARRADAVIDLLHVPGRAGRGSGPLHDAEERLRAADVRIGAAGSAGNDGRPPHAHLLEARERHDSDLLALCAPFLEDFAELGADSAGTTLDVLLQRSKVPLLVARAPREEPEACLGHVVLPITPYGEGVVRAAAWALRVVEPGGLVRVVAVVDRETLDASAALADDLDVAGMDEEMLSGLRRPVVAGLIAALQRRASESDLACRVSVRSGDTVAAVAALVNEETALLVTSRRDAGEGAAERALGLVRASRNPVLAV